MAEFSFYATKEESLAMLRDLFAHSDLRVIVGEQRLPKPSAKIYTTFTENLAREVGQAYTAHLYGSFSTHPPLFTKSEIDGAYFLSDTGGGPKVLYHLAALYEGRVLTQGSLWTQRYYELPEGNLAWASPAVKAAHADMVRRMKKHLCRWEGLWISPGALLLLKEGKAELPGDLKPLGTLLRKAKELPQLSPALVVPATSKKTTKRKIAAKTAAPQR